MTMAEALRQEGVEIVAKRLLAMKVLSLEKVAEATGLSTERVKALEAADREKPASTNKLVVSRKLVPNTHPFRKNGF